MVVEDWDGDDQGILLHGCSFIKEDKQTDVVTAGGVSSDAWLTQYLGQASRYNPSSEYNSSRIILLPVLLLLLLLVIVSDSLAELQFSHRNILQVFHLSAEWFIVQWGTTLYS